MAYLGPLSVEFPGFRLGFRGHGDFDPRAEQVPYHLLLFAEAGRQSRVGASDSNSARAR